MTTRIAAASVVLALSLVTTQAASAEGLLTTHRIPASLAAEAVQVAVATCAGQNFPVSAVVLDADGVEQAFLRGDDAGIHTLQMAHAKAYTAVSFHTNTSALDAQAASGRPPSPAIAKLPDLVLAPGGVVILGGSNGKELLGAIAVSGVPNHQGDEVCAKAGLAKIADRLK